VISKKLKNRARSHALRQQMDAALADFSPPTLEEMLEEGNRLFKPEPRVPRTRRTPKASRTRDPRGTKRRVTVFRQDNPKGERTADYTRAGLLAAIRRKRPRRKSKPDWMFSLGDKRHSISIGTDGPRAFSGQYPVWRGRAFAGCMLAALGWADVRMIIEKFYEGRAVHRCFGRIERTFVPYPAEDTSRRR
jgi:hypothetical protein